MSTAAARFRRLLAVLPRFAEAPSQSLAALAARAETLDIAEFVALANKA